MFQSPSVNILSNIEDKFGQVLSIFHNVLWGLNVGTDLEVALLTLCAVVTSRALVTFRTVVTF